MSDEDPFSYTPLRVSKRKKRMAEGRQKKKRQGEEADIKEEIKEGIIEVFAGNKRRQLVDDIPSGDCLMVIYGHYIKAMCCMVTYVDLTVMS